ncbi:hypothetical protein [Curtobacterium sp. 9128]|uniref:hypothetical protein n=1 Tax=Curtobacterium sp. 9128 TaxID=1793722 RepID=UPI0016426677|nr:hypothetical protein [Curtobacterium sp. 9128]
MRHLTARERALLRAATVVDEQIIPVQRTVHSPGNPGRPTGRAYGKPFGRPGLVAGCAHTRCWEPDPLSGDLLDPEKYQRGTVVAFLQPGAAHAIQGFRPQFDRNRWEHIRLFVADAVAVIAPACHYLAERLMVVTSGFVDWVVNVCGYPALMRVVFHPVMIRRYVSRDDKPWQDKTRRDYRSLLLRIAEVVVPEAGAIPFGSLNTEAPTLPYTDRELGLLESWARGQSSAQRRRDAGLILGLAAGAGLDPWEIQHLRDEDVVVGRAGVRVTVAGSVPREVTVLQRWEDLVRDSLMGRSGREWVFGPATRTSTFNAITPFIRRTDRGNEPTPVPTRMRQTWIVTHLAARTPADLIMAAGGLTKPEHLATSLAHIPALHSPDERRRVIREARDVRSRRH